MIKGSYEVEVLVNGSTVKEYSHEGKTFIEGKKGSSFSIRLRNNSNSRKLFVVSVDGLSVLDGKDATSKGRGYMLRGNSSMTVDGWRKSDDAVAEFYFSGPEDSYRRRKNKGNNLGAIGVVVYNEKTTTTNTIWPPILPWDRPDPAPWYKHRDWFGQTTFTQGDGWLTLSTSPTTGVSQNTSSSVNYCANASNGPTQDLGTGWGKEKHSEVVSVDFEREDYPDSAFTLYYNTREQLKKEGVEFKERAYVDRPKTFPGDYCEPPQK